MLGPLPIDDDCVLYAEAQDAPEARRQLVCRFLSDRLGERGGDIRLSTTPAGQPIIEGQDNLSVSWAHRPGFLLIGVAARRVGVDLEIADRVFPPDEVVATFFSRKERRVFHRLMPHARLPAFYLLWTLREAYLKALGQSLDAQLGKEVDFSAVLQDGTVPDEVAQTIRGRHLAGARVLSRLVSVKGRQLRVAKITGS